MKELHLTENTKLVLNMDYVEMSFYSVNCAIYYYMFIIITS